jgi:phosphoribosylamine--glycine ligase
MHFTLVSKFGEGAHLLHQIKTEGNEVEAYIQDSYYRRVWDGLLPKVDEVKPPEGSVVIFDFSGMGEIADDLKAAGYAVIGGSKFADQLEQDRMFGIEFAEKNGIKVPLTANFDQFSVKEVEDFIAENGKDKRFVFKPSGKGLPTFLTYCAQDSGDLVNWVSYVDKHYGKNIESFLLQEFVEGVCVSSEGWCDGVKFVRPSTTSRAGSSRRGSPGWSAPWLTLVTWALST